MSEKIKSQKENHNLEIFYDKETTSSEKREAVQKIEDNSSIKEIIKNPLVPCLLKSNAILNENFKDRIFIERLNKRSGHGMIRRVAKCKINKLNK